MAKLLRADDTSAEITPNNGKYFTLQELRRLVGGDIELLPMSGSRWLVVNEEGHLEALPSNMNASMLSGNFVVGDAVVCSRSFIR